MKTFITYFCCHIICWVLIFSDYVKNLAEKYALPLTLNNNFKKGYHIHLSLNTRMKKTFKNSDLPPEFIQVGNSSHMIIYLIIKAYNCNILN